jgi:hypothetical protein
VEGDISFHLQPQLKAVDIQCWPEAVEEMHRYPNIDGLLEVGHRMVKNSDRTGYS